MGRADGTRLHDVIVVGGGPAGLSAALVLARARRRVLVVDDGRYRNERSRGLHAYLTRDGILPEARRRLGRAEIRRYGVRVVGGRAIDARREPDGGFRVRLSTGSRLRAKRLLLATGVRDRLPSVPGMSTLYGVSVHHCPFCDGWEWRDRALAVYGRGESGADLCHSLLAWSADVVLLTNGPSRLAPGRAAALARRGVRVITSRIGRLEGPNGRLRRVRFHEAEPLARDALFLATGNEARTELALKLACRVHRRGSIWTDRRQCSSVAGVYVAGDASRDVQFAIVAAAEGARAAVAMHRELVREESRNHRRSGTDEKRLETPPAISSNATASVR
jgi:thioredoxin reductase